MGCIFGSGTNAAYIEGSFRGQGQMCVCTEWGNFGADEMSRRFLPISGVWKLYRMSNSVRACVIFGLMMCHCIDIFKKEHARLH